jgi:molybdopterin-guanine dinucleotide biosynthesis protein A
MGRDKAHLRLGKGALVERVLAAVAPLEIPCALIANRPEAFTHLGLPAYADLRAGAGPLGGLHAALSTTPAEAVLLLACDLPFVTTRFLRYLVGRLGSHQAVVPRGKDGFQPLCAVYARSCLPAVERLLDAGAFKVMKLLPEVDMRILRPDEWRVFDPHGRLFINLNTPADYQRALEWVGQETGE